MIHTLILPGFSHKNKEWAEDVARNLHLRDKGEVVYWRHWQSNNPSDFDINYEADHISQKIMNKKYCIIAKSVGTLVAMKVLRHYPALLDKLILCGIPMNDLNENDLRDYQSLHQIEVHKITVFQNSADPHGNFDQAKEFLDKINPAIKIIKKESDTHDYPYFEEFGRILNQ